MKKFDLLYEAFKYATERKPKALKPKIEPNEERKQNSSGKKIALYKTGIQFVKPRSFWSTRLKRLCIPFLSAWLFFPSRISLELFCTRFL